ncbi:SH3 domain-containing protein [Cyanobium sp. T1B-Tous]|uniref:SH3 domain-containing protein n=2 Tax=unclassified Cyanobium TaxID=2627006 RepID=UPI0020CDAF83|nr:SH3 domain-containing protein [Cyanobium sp. T1B-Tous]
MAGTRMTQSSAAWRWAALLGFALITPVGLPAGGADRRPHEVRRRSASDPLISSRAVALRVAPEQRAPALQQLGPGEPLRVLRSWRGSSGQRWLQVQVADRRGWVPAG